MAEKKMFPFIPSNYVSILQLQERWIREKEQQLPKKEPEEEEEQRRSREEDEQKRREEDEQKRREEEEEKLIREEPPDPGTVANRPHPLWNWTRYNRRKPVASRPKPKAEEEEEVKAEVGEVEVKDGTVVVEAGGGEEVRNEERKTDDDDSKKKKGNKNGRSGKKKKKEEGNSKKVEKGDTEPPATEVVVVEESIPARRNSEGKGKRSVWRSKSEFATAAASGKVWEVKDDPKVEIGVKMEEVEQKFGDLSVNNRRKGEGREKARLRFERNGGGGGRHLASGRFGGGWERRVRKPIHGSLVWVKKEEACDGNNARILCSEKLQ